MPVKSLAFEAIRLLHEAGLTASLDTGIEVEKKYRWLLEIRTMAPKFALTDRKRNRKSEVATLAEVIKLAGGKGVR